MYSGKGAAVHSDDIYDRNRGRSSVKRVIRVERIQRILVQGGDLSTWPQEVTLSNVLLGSYLQM